MAITKPIKSKSTLKRAVKWLNQNADPAFALGFKIAASTGLRITDISLMKYEDIDHVEKTITIEENKGTKQRVARAKRKVLEDWYKNLFLVAPELRDQLLITKPAEVLSLEGLNPAFITMIEMQIQQAVASVKPKVRTVDLSKELLTDLRTRQAKFEGVDGGFIFSTKTINSNRAKGKQGVITRQSFHKWFSAMGEALTTATERVNGSCHGLRKTFARWLYETNTKDLNLVMHVMGWSSVALALRYLGLDDEQRKQASTNLFNVLDL